MSRARSMKIETFNVRNSTLYASDGYALRRVTIGSGRTADITWAKEITREIDIEGSPEDVIANIAEAAKGLTDAGIQLEKYNYPYDETAYHRVIITGWTNEVTADNIDAAIKAQEEEMIRSAAQNRRNAQNELAQIRANYPDLLTED